MTASTTVLDTARQAYVAGLCVVPPKEDGSKEPIGAWKQWQQVRPSVDQMRDWYLNGHRSGVGLICGRVSGGLELFEFDDHETYRVFRHTAEAASLGDLVERIEAGYLEETPGGGVHWLYRCAEISGSTKLARRPGPPDEKGRPTVKTLIETKSEGGYVVIAPSNGRVHPSGGAYRLMRGSVETIATIEPDERCALFELAAAFDEMPKQEYQGAARSSDSDNRPGDDFNWRADWRDVLEPAGWVLVDERDGVGYWRRPGKDRGISATTNYAGSDLFYCFSSSTPFEPERGYSKWRVYAILEHGGDFAAAARELRRLGYGDHEPRTGANAGTGDSPTQQPPAWPEPLAKAAYHGLAGKIVRAIEPHTEADPVALLLTLLAAVGNIVGTGPHWRVSGRSHGLRVYPVLVGETSKGRKGTAWGAIKPILGAAAPDWLDRCTASGMSSGEGLIWAVRDQIVSMQPVKERGRIVDYQEVIEDPGVADKRLFLIEEEFARVIKSMGREANTLSAVIRQAWDDGDLRTLTKNTPARATGAHITIVGHITKDELLRHLSDTEAGNGFANRFAWACVRRSKVLPEGGNVHTEVTRALGAQLASVFDVAERIGLLSRDEAANRLWHKVYGPLSEGGIGLLGAVTSRAEAQVMRIASIYALLDKSNLIRPEHLQAAVAVWDYCEASARYVFGDVLGDPVADTILNALRQSGELTRTDIRDLFGRNLSAVKIDRALTILVNARKARMEKRKGDGVRPVEVWLPC